MPKVVEDGRVYVVDSPLFVASYKDKRFYSHSMRRLNKKLKKLKLLKKAHISRLKGHGEADRDEVREYAINPATRRLFKLTLKTGKDGRKQYKLIRACMGKDVSTRRRLLGLDEVA